MQAITQSPVTGEKKLRPRSDRKPLQPKNSQAINNLYNDDKSTKPKQEWIEISLIGDANKENHPIYSTPTKIQPLDSSLAEELSAIKKKLERLKLDKEKTEKMLKEKDMAMEIMLKELEQRGEIQNTLEIEVDRLYRLKELRSHCMRVSPIRSLRGKEQQRKVNEAQKFEVKAEGMDEFVDECELQSPETTKQQRRFRSRT
ncbi:High mobility group B protein 6 [Quillaja saponaria]|uniref:High mobility group B protein 6 n=1 Tax=Quillaja saponaria TaxID=32244 RepID=A0AAD7PCT2_QUISA|nr:High mobility group B protein 6 [Quillaja saponaria]